MLTVYPFWILPSYKTGVSPREHCEFEYNIVNNYVHFLFEFPNNYSESYRRRDVYKFTMLRCRPWRASRSNRNCILWEFWRARRRPNRHSTSSSPTSTLRRRPRPRPHCPSRSASRTGSPPNFQPRTCRHLLLRRIGYKTTTVKSGMYGQASPINTEGLTDGESETEPSPPPPDRKREPTSHMI